MKLLSSAVPLALLAVALTLVSSAVLVSAESAGTSPVVDALVERVASGPADTAGRYRVAIVASEPGLFIYFDRVLFAEEEGGSPTSTGFIQISSRELAGDRSVIRIVEVAGWKTNADVTLSINDSRRCDIHLSQKSYQTKCQ